MRATKASVFLPWDPASYVVWTARGDLSNLGCCFCPYRRSHGLERQQSGVRNVDWQRGRTEPNLPMDTPDFVTFGRADQPCESSVDLELWLRNSVGEIDRHERVNGLAAQVCVC